MLMTLLQTNYLSLFNWVLTTSAKASIFIVFLLGVKHVLRHRMGARFQYMLWSVLFIGLVLPWTPSSPVSVYNLANSTYIQQVLAPISNGATQPTPTVVDTKRSSLEQTTVVDSNSNKAPLATDTQRTSGNNMAPFAIFPFIYKLMFLIWLLGILILTILTVIVDRRFCNKIEHNLVTDSRLITAFNQLKVGLKIKAEIPLVKTRHVNSPSLLGFIHPKLLLPIEIEQTFSLEQINHIFLHELLHFKRKDIMINWLTQVLVIIHWFNPLIWYAFYRMREDQEISCDALAIDRIDPQQSNGYAYTLIKLVETYSNTPRLAGLASLSGSKSQIRRRLTMIKDSRRGSVKWSVLGFLVIALIATAVFTSTANLGDSEAQGVVKEYKSKLYNVSYNSINMGNAIKDNDEYKQFFTQKAFEKFTNTRVMLLPRQVADNKKYNLQLKDIRFKKASSTEKNKLIFDYELDMNVLSVTGSNSVENEVGQVTLVKEDGQWKIDNDWFNLNDTFKKGLILDVRQVDTASDAATNFVNEKGYKVALNGVGSAYILLSNSFDEQKDGVKIGELLSKYNQLSKQNGLDFSGYLGKKVYFFALGLEKDNKFLDQQMILLLDGNKVVGYWLDETGDGDASVNNIPNLLTIK